MGVYPQEWEIVDRGVEAGREYVVTVCTSMGEPTEYGSRHVEAFYDRRMRKPRLRVKHFRHDRYVKWKAEQDGGS